MGGNCGGREASGVDPEIHGVEGEEGGHEASRVEEKTGVGKHTELIYKQTGTETEKRTFTDVIKKGKLSQDLLNKVPVEQLKEVFGKELNRSGRASLPPEAHNLVKL